MKKAKIIGATLTVLVTLPIWYYLLYQILVRVHASDIMFFLFWIYAPVGLLAAAINAIANSEKL